MSEDKTENKIDTVASYVVGIVSTIIAIPLTILVIVLVTKIDITNTEDLEKGTIILSVIIPFVLFFGIVALRGLTPRIANQKELMSVQGWRIMALVLLIIGITGSIIGHWFAIVLPVAMAYICMMKDRKFMEKLRAIRLIP